VHSFLLLGIIARMSGAKIIVEFHETMDTAEAQYPLAVAYVRAISRPFIALSSAAAVHSTVDRDNVRQRFPALRRRPVGVVPLGTFNMGVDPARWAVGRPVDEPFRLLYFGTIRPYKGLENLVRAFSSLQPEQAELFTLTIVGETWEGWTLPSELIETSPYRHRISFVNTYVTDAEAVGYYSSADAVVLPYLRSSASGPLHMAMSHGVPVAVSAVGGLVEAVHDYTGARLVAPGDVSDLAAALFDLREMPGPHADPHSWLTSVRRLTELF